MQFRIPKIITLVVATMTLCVLFFGLSHFGIIQHMNGQMIDCPFMPGHTSVCKMSPIEHLQLWQYMFTILPTENTLSLLSALLPLLFIFGLKYFRKFSVTNLPQSHIKPFYLRNTLVFNPIKEALSKGILNPKLF